MTRNRALVTEAQQDVYKRQTRSIGRTRLTYAAFRPSVRKLGRELPPRQLRDGLQPVALPLSAARCAVLFSVFATIIWL